LSKEVNIRNFLSKKIKKYDFFTSNLYQCQHFVIHFVFENEKQIQNVFSPFVEVQSLSICFSLSLPKNFWGKRFWMRSLRYFSVQQIGLNQVHPHSISVTTWKAECNTLYSVLKLKGDFKRVERNFMKLKESERQCVWVCV